jgi:hypothetical protein
VPHSGEIKTQFTRFATLKKEQRRKKKGKKGKKGKKKERGYLAVTEEKWFILPVLSIGAPYGNCTNPRPGGWPGATGI